MRRHIPAGAHRRRRRPMSEINVVPYIDVMLVLLVIFMVTAPLIYQGVAVDLPQAATEPLDEPPDEPLVVTVDVDGKAYLNIADDPESALDREALMERVAAVMRRDPERQVIVRGDSAAAYGAVVEVMADLQGAGVPRVGLSTRPPEAAGGG